MKNVLLVNVTASLVPGIINHLSAEHISVKSCKWSDISIQNTLITANTKSLESYDLIVLGSRYLKSTDPNQEKIDVSELYALVSNYLSKKNIKQFKFSIPTLAASKVSLLSFALDSEMQQIPTQVFTTHHQLLDHVQLTTDIFPFVLKHPDQDRGRGVVLAKTKEDILLFLKNNPGQQVLIKQKFINNDGDYRLFIVKGKLLGAMKRTSTNSEEFRNNISLGGQGKMVSLPQDIIDKALDLAKKIGCDVQGMDLIQDKLSKEYYVMEVNTNPQYKGFQTASKINIAAEISIALQKMLK